MYCFASPSLSFLILLGVLDAETGTVGPREERANRGGIKRVVSGKEHKVRPAVTQCREVIIRHHRKVCLVPTIRSLPVTLARSILVKSYRAETRWQQVRRDWKQRMWRQGVWTTLLRSLALKAHREPSQTKKTQNDPQFLAFPKMVKKRFQCR